MSIVVSTLASYLGNEHELTLHCGDCQHHSTLDLRRLIETFGPDYDVVKPIRVPEPFPLLPLWI